MYFCKLIRNVQMESNVDTVIQFSGLKSGIYHYDFTLNDSFFSDYNYEKILGGEVFFGVKLEKKERLMLFHFTFSGKVKTPCDRCLDEIDWPVEGDEHLCVKLSDKETSDDENVVILPENAFKIDLAQWMFEFVAVSMPIRCIHPDDAEGNTTCNPDMLKYISEEAGSDNDDKSDNDNDDEEIDPRWEALAKLKK